MNITKLPEDLLLHHLLEEDARCALQTELHSMRNGARPSLLRCTDESIVRAIQQLLTFSQIPSTLRGFCKVDGDLGPGTRRALAIFKSLLPPDHPCRAGIKINNDPSLLYAPTAAGLRQGLVDEEITLEVLDALISSAQFTWSLADNPAWYLANYWSLCRGLTMSCRDMWRLYGKDALEAEDSVSGVPAELMLAIAREETGGIAQCELRQDEFVSASPIPERNVARDFQRVARSGLGLLPGRLGGAAWMSIRQQLVCIGQFLLDSPAAAEVLKGRQINFEACSKIARYYRGPSFVATRYNHRILFWYRQFALLRTGS